MNPRLNAAIAVLILCAQCAVASEPMSAEELRAAHKSLALYRGDEAYYQEAWRPQFHFSPERNWMNDPNGLVFHRGEWHLFYQHNPVGIEWGHMSWGHAVSRNLTHWEHLPLAIVEQRNEMIFSGSAVVDAQNSSGFGSIENPPLVAIYTSHKPAEPVHQAQSIAYSLDDGRTWTKYAGNPVLDLNARDFRDPKVMWHEPTERWVMLVSLAADKRLQFYGSSNLKDWKLLSEFGPAGATEKLNWECPDLFELPIENADGEPTGKTAWVLEVDMGNGSVAGGSGGEYFVGDFDGERFTCKDPTNPSQWVDYGRDFYAAVSWSDVPERDGRRVWIGWMNNWETCLVPTSPWRSEMSIPRTLTLRECRDGLRLVQRPVQELAALRADHTDGLANKIRGRELDIELEIAVADEKPIELAVFKGEQESTVVGYSPTEKQLYIDRRQSGVVDFHPAFAGVYRAPLSLRDGVLRLRVLIDRSSIEVFADDGVVVSTNRIFPSPDSDRVDLTAGESKVMRFDAWRMKSVWPAP